MGQGPFGFGETGTRSVVLLPLFRGPARGPALCVDDVAPQGVDLSDIAAWSSAELSVFEDNFSVKTFQGDEFLIDKKDGELEIKDGVGETAGFKEVDILTCQGYLHVIDKVLFYDDADGSDGARATTIGVAAGAVALGAALL